MTDVDQKESMNPEPETSRTFYRNIDIALHGTEGQYNSSDEKEIARQKRDERHQRVENAKRSLRVKPSVVEPGEKISRIPVPGRRGEPLGER